MRGSEAAAVRVECRMGMAAVLLGSTDTPPAGGSQQRSDSRWESAAQEGLACGCCTGQNHDAGADRDPQQGTATDTRAVGEDIPEFHRASGDGKLTEFQGGAQEEEKNRSNALIMCRIRSLIGLAVDATRELEWFEPPRTQNGNRGPVAARREGKCRRLGPEYSTSTFQNSIFAESGIFW